MMVARRKLDFVPVIIIGAGRSGTKMLRDVLWRLPWAGTWPCDEINNVWRHGNASLPHDELERRHARPRVRHYVQRQFVKCAASGPYGLVVEKTCANSLRVGFVDEVLPSARFIHLVRDGRDATASALRRWQGDYSLGANRRYMSAKLRHVPRADLPVYGARLLRNAVHQRLSRENRVAHWGPRLRDLDVMLAKHPLEEVCAIQWQRCVDRAGAELSKLSSDRVFLLRYEDFIVRPRRYLQEIGDFLEHPVDDRLAAEATADVSDTRVGQGQRDLESDKYAQVESLVHSTLCRYGYT